MIFMKESKGLKRIDYTKTSFLIEAYRLGLSESKCTKQKFQTFQEAVKQQNDRVIFEVLNSCFSSVEYYF